MSTRLLIWTAFIVFLLAFHLGCTWREMSYRGTPVDASWGRSLETAKYSQMANPEIPANPGPVEAIDGETGKNIMNKYHKSFEKKAPQPVYNVSLGSVGM